MNPHLNHNNDSLKNHQKDGLHILSNFETDRIPLLTQYIHFKKFIDQRIEDLKLSKVGEAYHDFPDGGFTGVICLAESHLSIHTWPGRNYVTFDIYLSNHSKDNSSKAEGIYSDVRGYFKAKVIYQNFINR